DYAGAADGLGEARPPAARIVLVARAEQHFPRNDVDVQTLFVVVPELVAKRGLGALFLGHVVLHGVQLGLEVAVGHGSSLWVPESERKCAPSDVVRAKAWFSTSRPSRSRFPVSKITLASTKVNRSGSTPEAASLSHRACSSAKASIPARSDAADRTGP